MTPYFGPLRDLWRNKGRTALVILSITVGVAAMGMVITAQALTTEATAQQAVASHFPSIMLALSSGINDEQLTTLADLPEVSEVDGVATLAIRWKPTLESDWQNASLITVPDYQQQVFSRIDLRSGTFPDDETLAVESGFIGRFNVPNLGGAVYLELNDRARLATLTGAVYDPGQLSLLAAQPTFYVTKNFMERVGYSMAYLQVRAGVSPYTPERAEAARRALEDKLGKARVGVLLSTVSDPQKPPAQEILTAFLLILGVMGGVSLLMSVFLIFNLISSLVAQQTYQIGIMKAIGGLSGQIALAYLGGVLVYGLLGMALALPAGMWGGAGLANFLLSWFNAPLVAARVVPAALVTQVGMAVVTPVLAALWPIWRGTRITVRQAIAAYGLGTGQYGKGWIDRTLAYVRGLPRWLMISLRNTFRRPGRVALTQITLTVAGAAFMMVVSTQTSFDHTIKQVTDSWGFDVQIVLAQAQRVNKLAALLQTNPQVASIETWVTGSGKVSRIDAQTARDSSSITIIGITSDSRMFKPQLTAGRGLLPGDTTAILLNQKIAKDLRVTVGDRIKFDNGGGYAELWTVVGLVTDLSFAQLSGYVDQTALTQRVGGVGEASIVLVNLNEKTIAVQEAFATEARELLQANKISVSNILTILAFRDQASLLFVPLAAVMMVMAIFIAVVGSFSLSSTLSINVFERRREIGVMRAIGASSGDINRIVLTEGVLLGVISWLGALPISQVIGPLFLDAISLAFQFPMTFQYALISVWIWLGIVVVLALIASWWPARRATQISVMESLAYE